VGCKICLRLFSDQRDGSTARKQATRNASEHKCKTAPEGLMLPVTDNENAAQAKYALELALLDGAEWQLLIGEAQATILHTPSPANHEFTVEWGKLVFAWWDDERAQSWRVVGYEIESAQIQLRAMRSFGRDLTTLTLRDVARWRAKIASVKLALAEQRQVYAQTLPRLLAGHFVKARIKSLSGSNCSLSDTRRYQRLRIQSGKETSLVIGVSPAENQEEIDGIVATGLVWLAGFNQGKEANRRAQRLCFCLPRDRAQTVIERLSLLERRPFGAQLQCFETDEPEKGLVSVPLATQPELLTAHPRQLRWSVQVSTSKRWRAQILNLAPDLIEARPHPQLEAESFSLHGLEFARADGRGLERVRFGVAGLPDGFAYSAQVSLTEETFPQLAQLVNQIALYRSARAPDRRHPFYRLRAEAWLESLLCRGIRALDATLDERFVYSQIPAWRADERSVLDLLTINHQGRLVVIEIKASEDPQLPLQGLDYWLRVEQAKVRGEFARRGLFTGIMLAEQPPLLYLVAPRLRFHRSFNTLAQCISPEIEAYRIGINTNWRSGVQVHTRERLNSGAVMKN
jgi:hypothetical protein